jgi:HSP20 family protein
MKTLQKNRENLPVMRSSLWDMFDFDRLFDRDLMNYQWFNKVPAANIVDKKDSFMINLAVPGMEKKDFHVKINTGLLTISAEKEEKFEDKDEEFTRKEYNYNSFTRSFVLPESVKTDGVQAKYENGVLNLTLPKKEEVKKSSKTEIKIN